MKKNMKYIKEKMNQSRKQLMLLPLMLITGGVFVHAQEASQYTDTIYVKFASPVPATVTLEYGQKADQIGSQITWLSYEYKNDVNSPENERFSAEKAQEPGAVSFNGTMKDLVEFSVERPVVNGENQTLKMKEILDSYFTHSVETMHNIVFRAASDAWIPLTITPAPLYVSAKDTVCEYGEERPVYDKISDFTYAGFLYEDNAENVFSENKGLPTVNTTDWDKTSAAGSRHNLFVQTDGVSDNYTIVPVNVGEVIPPEIDLRSGLLTITQAPLALALPDSVRLYDDATAKDLIVSDPEQLKNGEVVADLFVAAIGNLWLPLKHTAKDGTLKSDVGEYIYNLTDAVLSDLTENVLKNYMVELSNEAKYTILPDTAKIFIGETEKKIYGEISSPVPFAIGKRVNDYVPDPVVTFTEINAEGINDILTSETVSGFTVAPEFQILNSEGKEDNSIESEAGVYSIVTKKTEEGKELARSTNYVFLSQDGKLEVEQRELAFNKVVVDRVYGTADHDTTWFVQPNVAAGEGVTPAGLTIFDQEKIDGNIDAIFGIVDVMPKVQVKESAADLTTHAGKWTGEHEIVVISREEQNGEVTFESKDKNYKLNFDIFGDQVANPDSVVLDIAKAP